MSRPKRWRARAGAAILLPAGLLGVLSPALDAQESPVDLRLRARPGQSATYLYEQRIDLRMPREFGGEQRIVSRLVVTQRTEEADDSSIRYLAEVEDLGVEMQSSPEAGDLDFSRFEGQRFRMTVDRRGALREVTPVGDGSPDVAQLEQSIRQVGFPILPRRPVRVGETWVDTTRIDASAMALPARGEIVSIRRTTLERLVSTDEGRVAELAVRTAFHFEPSAPAIPGMQVDVTGSRSDAVRFDVTRGRFLASRGEQEFELQMAIPGAASSLSIQGTATNRAELRPDS